MEVRLYQRVVITLTTLPNNLEAKEIVDILESIIVQDSRRDLLQVVENYVSIYEDTLKVEPFNDTVRLSFTLYTGDVKVFADELQDVYSKRVREYSRYLELGKFAHEHGRKSTKPGNGKYIECQ